MASPSSDRDNGLLQDLGSEINSIIYPVTICMLLVVLMVRGLTPDGSSVSGPALGTLIYQEESTDSTAEKIEGALLNAGLFIVAITVMTFILVAMFYFRCTKFIWAYMGFSGLIILAWLGGSVAVQIIQTYSIPLDIFSFALFLYNFSVVGVLAVFFCRMPIFLTQSYLVLIGAIVAFWFTHLPEWTTWLLLIAMSLYDLFAVLTPGGPLKLLIELAVERNEEIPALVYEGRPASLSRPANLANSQPSLPSGATQNNDPSISSSSSSGNKRGSLRPRSMKSRWREANADSTDSAVSGGRSQPLTLLQNLSSGTTDVQGLSKSEEERRISGEVDEYSTKESAGLGASNFSIDDAAHPLSSSNASSSVREREIQKNIDEFLPELLPSSLPLKAKLVQENDKSSSDDSDDEDDDDDDDDEEVEHRPLVGKMSSSPSPFVSTSKKAKESEFDERQTQSSVVVQVFETGLEEQSRGGRIQNANSSTSELYESSLVIGEDLPLLERRDEEDLISDSVEGSSTRVDEKKKKRKKKKQKKYEKNSNKEDEELFALPDAIKLGLGDFIFYSVLVGRAAMYDLMTVYACYLAIIAGLGLTLVLLVIHKKALPALPISIALGIVFYLFTRWIMDPMVVNLTLNLLFI